tara:strand:- start:181 stop:480 length:300 start_codon:yes stop_codon:yes gene_type:complete
MAIIFEKPFPKDPNGPVRQFTNCCGACDKGVEGGVACRACYDYIEEYVDEDNVDYFKQYIFDPEIKKKFEEFLADKTQTYKEWDDNLMKKIYKEMGVAR